MSDADRTAAVDRRLQAAAREAGDALAAYVYDLEALRRHALRVMAALRPHAELFYAIKANSELPILQTLAGEVDGFEASSGGELAWLRAHFPATRTIFSGPGKTDAELRLAVVGGADAIHVESLHELRRLHALNAPQPVPVLLRVNLPLPGLAATTLMMGGRPTPFGIAADQVPAVLAALRTMPGLRLRGFHFHLLSHQLDAAAQLALVGGCLDRVEAWCDEHHLTIDHVNLGGGIGIDYVGARQPFDLARFGTGLGALRAARPRTPRLRFEWGRYLTAGCGSYAMQVLDIKQAFGRHYLLGRGGTHHFRTPAAQGHSHPFRVLPVEHWPHRFERAALHGACVHVVGQLCTPKDVLAFDAPVERVRIGDLLVFGNAGAYAWHISHHDFLRHPPPLQCYLPVASASH